MIYFIYFFACTLTTPFLQYTAKTETWWPNSFPNWSIENNSYFLNDIKAS